MSFYLTNKIDGKWNKLRFANEDEALRQARSLITAGEAGDLLLEDDTGIIADDAEVRDRLSN
jgi:hypothetical protein